MNKSQKLKHIIVSYENFEKLRKYGYANDSMNDVITKILEKNKSSESGSEVETVPNLKKILEKNKMGESGSRVGELTKF